ncbi:MAG TPA: hypothetical protein VGD16_00345 [Enterovirga sp.]
MLIVQKLLRVAPIQLHKGAHGMPVNNGKGNLTASIVQKDLIGANGKDYLSGDDQANDLHGGNGKDTIWGGKGSDTLSGGNGNDTFVYKAGDLTPIVDLSTPFGWHIDNQKGGGTATISTTYGDSHAVAGGGSLAMHTGASDDKIDYQQ